METTQNLQCSLKNTQSHMHSLPLTALAIITQLSELAEPSKTAAYVAQNIQFGSCTV